MRLCVCECVCVCVFGARVSLRMSFVCVCVCVCTSLAGCRGRVPCWVWCTAPLVRSSRRPRPHRWPSVASAPPSARKTPACNEQGLTHDVIMTSTTTLLLERRDTLFRPFSRTLKRSIREEKSLYYTHNYTHDCTQEKEKNRKSYILDHTP